MCSSDLKALGDELYVIVARDSMVKHKPKPVVPEAQRLAMVQGLRIVDKAMLGSETDIFEPLREIKPDIIAIGKNQHFDEKELEKQLEARGMYARVSRIHSFKDCELCSTGSIIRRIIEIKG